MKKVQIMALMQMDFRSETLKRTVTVNVILPIEKYKGPYPTLYLLHGLTDNFNGWLTTEKRLSLPVFPWADSVPAGMP